MIYSLIDNLCCRYWTCYM